LLDCGASFGEGYGPVVVSAKPMKKEDIKGKRIGVPGLKTTAYLSLKLYEPEFEAVVDAVRQDSGMRCRTNLVEAGLLIHEGQLMFPRWACTRYWIWALGGRTDWIAAAAGWKCRANERLGFRTWAG